MLLTVTLACAVDLGAQCTGFLFETSSPPAVTHMAASDTGFTVQYWAWDDFNHRRSGIDEVLVSDVTGGIRLDEVDWVHASVCDSSGPVARTAVLFESKGPEGFGRWALVNLGADVAGTVDIDDSQVALGDISSRAVPVPETGIERMLIDDEYITVDLAWVLDRSGEALSDLVDDFGEPLSSIRGYAVYAINGPVATARPWDWSLLADLQRDAVNGFSTDTRATVKLRRSMWGEGAVCFAVALTYDGNGDAEGELPGSRSVHGAYLGVPSRWIALPPLDSNRPVGITEFKGLAGRTWFDVKWAVDNEPADAFYSLWIDQPGGVSVFLQRIDGGQGIYSVQGQLPDWYRSRGVNFRLELVDGFGRVLDEAFLNLSR